MPGRDDAKNLDDVKRDLYIAFNQAMKGVEKIGSYVVDSDIPKIGQVGPALSGLAAQIVNVEHEIAVQKAFEEWQKSGGRIDDEIAGGIVRDVKTMASLKLKPPGA